MKIKHHCDHRIDQRIDDHVYVNKYGGLISMLLVKYYPSIWWVLFRVASFRQFFLPIK